MKKTDIYKIKQSKLVDKYINNKKYLKHYKDRLINIIAEE